LRVVDLTGCWELNDQVLVNFLSRFPSLEVVLLGNIYSLTDLFMKGLATYTRNLHTLDIHGCWRISDRGVRIVSEYCRNLQSLSVHDCRDVTENALAGLRNRGVRIDRKLDPIMIRLQQLRKDMVKMPACL